MPNCFSLTRKGETKPTPLNKIDEEICNLVGAKVHPKYYYCFWFDHIGWKIAVVGKSFAQIRKDFEENFDNADMSEDLIVFSELLRILDYLEANYVPSNWVEIGRR